MMKDESDKTKNVPGAPPETEKPKPKNEKRPVFSYQDLDFSDYFVIDGRRYVRFFVNNTNPCYVDTFLSEFLDYQQTYFEAYNKAIEEGKECLCNEVAPPFEDIDKMTINVTLVNTETDEKTNEIEELPIYFVHSLSENLKISIHENHPND